MTWYAIIGYINTPTKDGRVLDARPCLWLRPVPLVLPVSDDHITVGVVEHTTVFGEALIACGTVSAYGAEALATGIYYPQMDLSYSYDRLLSVTLGTQPAWDGLYIGVAPRCAFSAPGA